MANADLVNADAILSRLPATSQAALFAAVAARGERLTGVASEVILRGLAGREALGTTGFGGGVALPYVRLESVSHPVALFARMERPIEYGALDGVPVDLVYCLFSPPEGSAEHLKALARASRALRDPGLTARLRGAADAASIHALLAAPPLARAA